MTGRAKWDAWKSNGEKYDDPRKVEERYLEIARTLGWTEETTVEDTAKPESSTGSDDDIWDKDDGTSKSGGGLGLAVSSMVAPAKVVDNSIYGLALLNDVSGLTTLLETVPETDLNALDEYVSMIFSSSALLKYIFCPRATRQFIWLVTEETLKWCSFF